LSAALAGSRQIVRANEGIQVEAVEQADVREPGRCLDRDISRGMAVDAEHDAFIERRHNQRVKDEGERQAEAIWRESERKEAARRREQNRGGWLDYYRRLEAGYLERATECGQRASELERTA
jgi:hypothetical protein